MTRLIIAAAASAVLVVAYSFSPLVAVGLAAASAAVLVAAVAVALRDAERNEISQVMEIIESCAVAERDTLMPVRMVS